MNKHSNKLFLIIFIIVIIIMTIINIMNMNVYKKKDEYYLECCSVPCSGWLSCLEPCQSGC